jgi:adenylate cyclase
MLRLGDVKLDLLGGVGLSIDGQPPKRIEISSKKARALLAYTAMHPNDGVHRDRLASMLWGNRCDALAYQNLRQCLHLLRTELAALAPGLLLLDGHRVALNPRSLAVDALDFLALSRSAGLRELERASCLYRGQFLADLNLEVEAFDDWAQAERSRLEAAAGQLFERCAERYDVLGKGLKAIDAATRLVEVDPLREDWQCVLLRLCARYRGSEAALGHARALTALLRNQLDVDPAPKTQAVIAEIQRGAIATSAARAGSSALSTARKQQNRLQSPRFLSSKPSIAVLPFTNRSIDSAQDDFAGGIVEDTITALSRSKSLSIIAPHTSRQDGQHVKVEGRLEKQESGADYVLHGSVRTAGNRVRVSARLVDARTGDHVWARCYDPDLTDLFAAQDAITSNIAASVEPHLYAAEGARANRSPPHALDARGCVMRARYLINFRSKENYVVAKTLLNKAIDLDPACTRAHSLLAYVTSLEVLYGWERRATALASAIEAAHEAIVLDIDDPWGHFALGFVHVQYRSPEEAVHEHRTALEINPHFGLARSYLGNALTYLGQAGQALAQLNAVEQSNTREVFLGVNNLAYANAYFSAERYCDAIVHARRAVRESPGIVTGYRQLVVNCVLAGEMEEARASLGDLLRLVPSASLDSINDALPYIRDSDRSRTLDAFHRLGVEPSVSGNRNGAADRRENA